MNRNKIKEKKPLSLRSLEERITVLFNYVSLSLKIMSLFLCLWVNSLYVKAKKWRA